MHGTAERSIEVVRFGHYEVLREIGRGGMASLHEARHLLLGTRVAIKRMLPPLAGGEVSVARFRNEALAAARVRHPNVVCIHDYAVDDDGVPYLVMELMEGIPLSAAIASSSPLSVREVTDLFLHLLAGVSAIHAAGVVHRDLKPQNVFLRRLPCGRSEPVVIDFGVAKTTDGAPTEDDDQALTRSGVAIGTAAYMAPEQIVRAKDVGPAADQYALGVTLYECLTGRTPFSGASAYEVMHAAMNAPLHLPGELRPDVPRPLDDAVARAMQRDPNRRFPSVHAMGEALLAFASEDAVLAWKADVYRTRAASVGDTLSAPRSVAPVVPHPRRRRVGTGAFLTFVAVAATGFAAGAAAGWTHGGSSVAAAAALPSTTPVAAPPRSATAAPALPSAGTAQPSPAPVRITAASATEADAALVSTPSRASRHASRFQRGTNGAPILE